MVMAIVVLAAWAGAASGLAWWLERRSHMPLRRRMVLVNFVQPDRPALRGILWTRSGPYLWLKQVELLAEDGTAVPFDGEVAIERVHVAFLQVLEARAQPLA